MDKYELIYSRLEKLIPDLTELRPGDARKSTSPGFMDLNLDVLSKDAEEMRIALAHNYISEGDVIADPDMEIRVYLLPGWKRAEALTFQDSFGYREVYHEENGQALVNVRAKGELNGFLKQWLKNALDQGHRLAPSPG